MNLLAIFRYCWRAIVNRSRIDQEVAEEFQFHLDAYAADLVAQGISPAEAARKARIDLGRKDTQNEKFRNAIGLRAFDELGTDIRYALRSLAKSPGYALVAVFSLALGIGATTAMFSLIYAALLHPFPYANADMIMNPGILTLEGRSQFWFATLMPQFEALEKAKSIESLLGFRNGSAELTGGELPEDVDVMYLSENADTFLGVPALLGRGIQPSDAKSGGQHVAVLNYGFWQRHFQGDEEVIGRTLQIEGENYTIVGVMPRSFAFNDTMGVSDVYLPGSLQRDTANPPIHAMYVPGNGKPFPDGSKIAKIEWRPKKLTDPPFSASTPDTVPGDLTAVEFIVKDSKRFSDAHGWGFAYFDYDTASSTFTPATTASKPPQGHDAKCGTACHTLAASKDYIFTAYPNR